MAIGRPIELTPNITSKNISVAATEGQTEFTVTGGYRINELAVYRNGVRLVDGRDFAATDGSTVNFISDTVVADDIVEFSVLDSFDVAGVIVSASSTQALSGSLNVSGDLYGGTVTGGTYYGDASNMSGIGQTLNVRTLTLGVSGIATISGITKVDNTTSSTSTSTGALIVTGGAGIGGDVYIGAGLSVAGTLTYEDVTNVDAVGMITAKSGVNISGGELKVGTAVTIGSAGIITSMGGTLDLKNAGSVSNIKFYCESGNSHYTALQSAAHSAYAGNVTLTLPTTTDTLIGRTTTDTLTNKTLTSPSLTSPTVSGGEFKVGTGVTIAATSGVATFSEDVTFRGGASSHNLVWDQTGYNLTFADNSELRFGAGDDFKIFWDHAGGEEAKLSAASAWIVATTGSGFEVTSANESVASLKAVPGASVELYENNSKKLETTNEGVQITGFTSTTAGMGITGGMIEGAWIKAGKLSDNLQIGIATANTFYFTTQESTTSTPNIRWNDTYSLSSKMKVGDVASVTVITTAAAGGYSANWTIDGNAVTEEWVGGSAPSEGGSDGLDIYSFTIIKTGTGTGDSGFKVIGNLSNASN